jgi:hypothetical protein
MDPEVSKQSIISTPLDRITRDTFKSWGRAAVKTSRSMQKALRSKGIVAHRLLTPPTSSTILEVME